MGGLEQPYSANECVWDVLCQQSSLQRPCSITRADQNHMVPPFSALTMPGSDILCNPVGFLPLIRERMERRLAALAADCSKLLLIIDRTFRQKPIGYVEDLLS